MNESPPPRSVFFELRGVLWVIVLAFMVSLHEPISPRLWLLGTIFLVSDLIMLMLPRTWFQNPRLGYGLFLVDTLALTVLLYSIPRINPELVLLYYLTIFMAMLNSNLRRSVQVGLVAGLVYVGLHYLNQHGSLLGEPSRLLGIPLFFVTAVSCGYLAQQIQSYKRELQDLQRVKEGLEGEIARTTDELTESERLRLSAEASERRFRNLVKDIDAIVWEMDFPTLKITFVSQQAERILGYSVQKWLGELDSWASIIHPDDRKTVVRLSQDAISGGQDYDLEYRALAADGRIVWLRDMVRLVRDAKGQVRQLRGVMVDITLQKNQEAEFKARADQESAIAALGQRALSGVDLSAFMDDAAPLVARTLNVNFCEILELLQNGTDLLLRAGKGWQTGLVGHATVSAEGDSLARFTLLAMEPVIIEDAPTEKRFSLPTHHRAHGIVCGVSVAIGGRDRPYGVLGAYSSHPRVFAKTEIAFLQTVANVLGTWVERKWAELALREREEKYRTLFEGVPVGLYRTAPDGKVLDVNAATVQMMGYPDRDSLVTLNSAEMYVHPEERERWKERMEREGVVRDFEIQSYRRDGKIIWLRDTARMIRDARSGAAYYEGTLEDITESKHLEEQLNRAQKMEAIGRLAGGIARDYNNLLTIIIGYSQLLQGTVESNDVNRSYVEEVLKAGERAASLTRQLLAFSRQQVLDPRVLDLNTVVAGMDQMLRRLIGEDIELLTVMGADLGRIKADPGQIEQVIMNLAVNSRDAMPEGGKMILETANVDLDEAYAGKHFPLQPGRYVLLALTDTGCGMGAETKSHIFEPFFTTKEKGKGTGLGLATVYGIVKQSGGYIWVYSEPGQGTTFKIHLPRVEDDVDDFRPAVKRKEQRRGSEVILVVEDENAVRALIRDVLQSLGYKVLEAPNGSEALALAEWHTEPISLVLTDVVMPGMSGRELVDRLVLLRPKTKVLFMSGYTYDAVFHHGVVPSGVPFLQKPFTSDALARKVREVLDAGMVH
jgi:PAS domain S-box-containing protein